MTTRFDQAFARPIFMRYTSRTDYTIVWPDDVPLPPRLEKGEVRFKMDYTSNPFHQVIERITGIAISNITDSEYRDVGDGAFVYGERSMYAPKESGYQLEGRVSVEGKTYRAFTSSHLFLIRGKLVDVGVLHVSRKDQPRGYAMENPSIMSASFWKSGTGIATAVVGAAALVGGIAYFASSKGATAAPGASNNPSGPAPTQYQVAQGSDYIFDVSVTQPALNWTTSGAKAGPALSALLMAAGWTILSLQPDPSMADGSRYALIAQWNSTATTTQDNPGAGWMIDAQSIAAVTSPQLPAVYTLPASAGWYSFSVNTAFPGVAPAQVVAMLQEMLSAAGFGGLVPGGASTTNILCTPSASNPGNVVGPSSAPGTYSNLVVNVTAQWNGTTTINNTTTSGFVDGPPLWWLVPPTGQTSAQPMPAAVSAAGIPSSPSAA